MIEKIILGTVQLGLNYGVNNTSGLPSKTDVHNILAIAQEHGITQLDTAAAYGEAENRIGEFHSQASIKFDINSKFEKENNFDWNISLKQSITRTEVSRLNTIMFHSFESYLNKKKEIPDFWERGRNVLFDKIGVSVYTNEELEKLLDDDFISVVQFPFNLLDNNYQRGAILNRLKDNGKEVHTRSCFLQGLFFVEEKSIPVKLRSLAPYIKEISSIASSNKLEIGHLALQYCLQNNLIDGVLIGVEKPEQLIQNINWSLSRLDESILNQIDALVIPNIELLNPSKW